MNSIVTILLLCALAPICWGKGCCTPSQWEGVQITQGGYAGIFRRGMIKEYNYVAYDGDAKRSAIFMKYINGDVEAKFKIVTRFDDDGEGGMLYVDNLGKHKCWKKHIKGEFRKCCIGDDAKDLGSVYLGLKGGFQVRTFEAVCPCGYGKSLLTVEEVKKGVCVPVGELKTGKVGHYHIMNVVSFLDITPGIKNATMFDVPKDCSENWDDLEHPVRDADMATEFTREHYILAV